MLLSIIISTKHKPPETFAPTLEGLAVLFVSAELAPGPSEMVEVIIIDQNEDRRMEALARKIVEQHPTAVIRYHSIPGTGLSKGRNEGLRRAAGEWLLFFDDDALLPAESFQALVPLLQKYTTKPAGVYGRVLTLETKQNYLHRFWARPRLGCMNFDSVCSIALIVNRAALNAVGSFDENFGVGARFGAGEESDLVLRLLKNKVPIYHRGNFISYHPAATPDVTKAYKYGEGLGALYRKHIAQSARSFFPLLLRLKIEVLGRIFLALVYKIRGQSTRSKFHLAYVRGFLRGFRTFRSLSHFAHSSTNNAP